MGARLRYDSTRLGFAILLFLALYLVLLPGNWPAPSFAVALPTSVPYGDDATLTVTVRSWHRNFSVRTVSFGLDTVNSTALSGDRPFVPRNLHEQERVEQWSLGLRNRLTWPVRTKMELRLPLSRLAKNGTLRRGTLQGRIELLIDHTRVTMHSGYPHLTFEGSHPFTLRIGG